MKKFKNVLVVLVVFLLCGCGITKEVLRDDDFKNIMIDEGYDVTDVKESYGYAKVAYASMSDDYKIIFVETKNLADAQGVYTDEIINLEKNNDPSKKTVKASENNWSSYDLTTSDRYYYVGLIENTYIYIEAKLDYKSDMRRLVKKLGC